MRCALASRLFVLLVPVMVVSTARAHGVRVFWELKGDSVFVHASFDDESPMAGARVAVFSGAEPSEPWITGYTDDEGCFVFVPDRRESSRWDVRVRKAGHGDIVHVSLDAGGNCSGGRSGFSIPQIIIMSACVIWGFIGTAFFFSARRRHG